MSDVAFWANGRRVAEGTPTRRLYTNEIVAFQKTVCRELIRAHHIRSGLPPSVQDLIAIRDDSYWLTGILAQGYSGPFCYIPNGESQDVVAIACFAAWYANLGPDDTSELREDIGSGHCYQYCPAVTELAQSIYRPTIVGSDTANSSTDAALAAPIDPYDPNSVAYIEFEIMRVAQATTQQRFVDTSVPAPNAGASHYVRGQEPAPTPPTPPKASTGMNLFGLGVFAAGVLLVGGFVWLAVKDVE